MRIISEGINYDELKNFAFSDRRSTPPCRPQKLEFQAHKLKMQKRKKKKKSRREKNAAAAE